MVAIFHHFISCLDILVCTPYLMMIFSFVVVQSCLTLCNPMNCNMPGFPTLHHLLEFPQIHVHWVSDTIQPSHPLLSPFPPAFNLSQHQDLFQRVSSHQVAKYGCFSFTISWRMVNEWIVWTNFLEVGLVGYPCSLRDSQESSPTPQFKSNNSLMVSFLYSPTLTSIRDYWKNHSFD